MKNLSFHVYYISQIGLWLSSCQLHKKNESSSAFLVLDAIHLLTKSEMDRPVHFPTNWFQHLLFWSTWSLFSIGLIFYLDMIIIHTVTILRDRDLKYPSYLIISYGLCGILFVSFIIARTHSMGFMTLLFCSLLIKIFRIQWFFSLSWAEWRGSI